MDRIQFLSDFGAFAARIMQRTTAVYPSPDSSRDMSRLEQPEVMA
ncbi:hypothetical protein HSB1_30020 [Halogranum salarium B-1]|uniref:Uncharacterized protein n=1 Tax=Halogranum salarium B-1 TaxID=1210908 RepID=J3JEN8_9EURY|nr:hypothetical protein HSB1_30020 [Halogranum salarium B-1]